MEDNGKPPQGNSINWRLLLDGLAYPLELLQNFFVDGSLGLLPPRRAFFLECPT